MSAGTGDMVNPGGVMKSPMTISHYWRIRIHATNEEQIFSTYLEGLDWVQKVADTFQEEILFDSIEIVERADVFLFPREGKVKRVKGTL
jgi:hypothetical protein